MFQPLVDFIQFDFVKYMLMSEVLYCLFRIIKLTITGRMSSVMGTKND